MNTLTNGDAKTRYLQTIDAFQSTSNAPQWLNELRARGRARFAELGFPTTRNEEWKYTDVTPIANLTFAAQSHPNGTQANLESFLFGDAHRLVFINGQFSATQSAIGELPNGVVVGSLAAAIANGNEAVQQHLGRYATHTEDDAFTALNTAFLHDGAFIFVPNNVVIERPIEVLWLASGHEETPAQHPRNLYVAGDNSQFTLVQVFAAQGSDVHFTNAVTEVVVGANAHVDQYTVQMENDHALHVGTLQVHAQRDSVFRSHVLTLGGRLVRNNANAVMQGENIECTLNGIVLGQGDQHVDNHTVMDHAMPHCNSKELFVHILDGRSTAVFNGKIFVRIDAQKTDAVQSNRTLLLSPDATINTKPQLEILADDVKCTHGATIGQLDEQALFYLRARGIPQAEARDLLTYAFAAEALEGVRIEALRERLEQELLNRLAQSRALQTA
jgi:Fe-S cluster assembly protein SufD